MDGDQMKEENREALANQLLLDLLLRRLGSTVLRRKFKEFYAKLNDGKEWTDGPEAGEEFCQSKWGNGVFANAKGKQKEMMEGGNIQNWNFNCLQSVIIQMLMTALKEMKQEKISQRKPVNWDQRWWGQMSKILQLASIRHSVAHMPTETLTQGEFDGRWGDAVNALKGLGAKTKEINEIRQMSLSALSIPGPAPRDQGKDKVEDQGGNEVEGQLNNDSANSTVLNEKNEIRANSLMRRGDLACRSREWNKALEFYTRALEIPDISDDLKENIFMNRSWIHLQLLQMPQVSFNLNFNLSESAESQSKANGKLPKKSEFMEVKEFHLTAGITDVESALQLSPIENSPAALYRLAQFHQLKGDSKTALTFFDQALEQCNLEYLQLEMDLNTLSFPQSGSTEDHSDVDVNSVKNEHYMPEEGKKGAEATASKQDINPLQMPPIMEKILSFLDLDSIKKARQVNKLWSAEGAKILIRRCYIKNPGKILLHNPSRKSKKKFRAFLAHTSRSSLVVPHITVTDSRDVDLWKSFGVFGNQVISVKLKISGDDVAWVSNLLDLLPNLKYLNIKNIRKKWEVIIKILTLRMAKFEADPNRQPLVISPMNLETNNLRDLTFIETLSNCNKIMTTELSFSMLLLDVGIPNFGARLANIINKFLSTNQNVLETLSMERCVLFLSHLEFPCMTQLNQIKLCCRQGIRGQVNHCQFSPSFLFSEKVPNLEHVTLQCRDIPLAPWNPNFLINLFSTTGKALSVKRLSYSGDSSDFQINPLFQVFPNVKDFQVLGTDGYSQKLFDSLWTHGKKLKKLHLHIFEPKLRDLELDSKFTGFTTKSVEIVNQLQKSGIHLTSEQWERLRVNPSILNLKELEHLVIHLIGIGVPENYLAFSGEFAFKHMPQQPKIFIYGKGHRLEGPKKALAQISELPNVNLVLKKKVHFKAR